MIFSSYNLVILIHKMESPSNRGAFRWSETESTRRHEDFQYSALPTELSDPDKFFNKKVIES